MGIFDNTSLFQPLPQMPQGWHTPMLMPGQQPTQQPHQQMQAPQQPGGSDLGSLLAQLLNDRHGRHLGTDGAQIAPQSPFGEPLHFQSAAVRKNEMDTHTGAYAPSDPAAMAQTHTQMFNAGITPPHHQVGQELPQQQIQFAPLPQASPNELSGIEQTQSLPGGSLPLGTLMSPQGFGYNTPAKPKAPMPSRPRV